VRYAAALATLLALLVVAAFLPCLRNDFVAWDDDQNFLSNAFYRGLGWSQIVWDWTAFHIGVYQPLAWMLLGAEYLVFGLQPWGYHLASVVLHVLDTVVLFVLTVCLLVRCRPDLARQEPRAVVLGAALAVALFAVHPLRTEVVAWASCQPYLPCALFAMLAVLAYLRAFPAGAAARRGWLMAALGLFVAALLSKAVAVSLPAVFLILDVYPLRRLGGGPGRWFGREVRAVWWEKIPFVVLSLIFIGLAVFGRVQVRHLAAEQHRGLSARIVQACYGIAFYALKTVLPWDLTAYYPVPERVVCYEFPFVACIIGTLAVSVGVFLLRRRVPGLLAAWLSYLVILAPNLGLVRSGAQIAADRYSYMATMGAVVVLAAGFCGWAQRGRRAWPAAAGWTAASVAALLGLIVLTRDQCRTWRSTEALWRHALDHGASRSCTAHNHLGLALQNQGRLAEAMAQYTESLRLDPTDVPAHLNRGILLEQQGRFAEAQADYAESLRLDPTNPGVHVNQGMLHERQGRLLDAESEYRESVRLDPALAPAHNNLGAVLEKQGLLDEAQAEYAKSVRLDPANPGAHTNLGALLTKQGRLEEARAEFAESLRLAPTFALARHNLAAVLAALGRLGEARAVLAEGLRLDPNDAAAHYSLAMFQLQQGQFEDALAHLAEVARLSPSNVVAHQARAWTWATCPVARLRDGQRAIAAATRACELSDWKDAVSLATLAAAYAEAGDFAQAVAWQTRAGELLQDERRRAAFRSALRLYEAGQPYREPSVSVRSGPAEGASRDGKTEE
jgi:Flp pilus assembly protein TadD